MALDFSNASAKVVTGLTTQSTTTRSWAWRFYRTGGGGGNLGRPWTHCGATTNSVNEEVFWNGANGFTYEVVRNGSLVTAAMGTQASNTNTWYSCVLTRDFGSNQLVFYTTDGTGTYTAPGSGAQTTASVPLLIGNRGDNVRNFAGRLADINVWDRVLDAKEAAAYIAGLQGKHITKNLVCSIDLVGDRLIDFCRSTAPTSTLTTAATHPRVYG